MNRPPSEETPKIRLFVTADLEAGAPVRLETEQAHYLSHVMRMRPGDEVALFNARHGEWRARIEGFGKRQCDLVATAMTRAQRAEPDLWLLFAPIKRTRVDFLVEKATELGVSVLWPVFTRFTDATRVTTDRLRAIAIEASEQPERLTTPEIRTPQRLERVFDDWPVTRRLLVGDETGGGRPVAEALAALPPGPAAVFVGPEGGFAKSELDEMRDLPFVTTVGLGPRILRADTAALAALACWQALRGDWREDSAL
ncbi:MAG: 16S rRNA (uracil(1498)-N(3))-methyltransferase [Alphaproteobacteria bacterium]|nr:16S rRNA (uracil(1498)-N(3))-methyltransferase [Alphaproteobacteria bacterium]